MGDQEENLEGLLYTSAAIVPFDADELSRLLASCKARNRDAGITGLLLMSGRSFMHYIEGPADALEETFNRISSDLRHREVTVYFRRYIEERLFPGWAMSLRTETDLPPDLVEACTPFFDKGFDDPPAAAEEAHKLLLRFAKMG